MEFQIHDRWVVLSVQVDPAHNVWVNYEDDRGNRRVRLDGSSEFVPVRTEGERRSDESATQTGPFAFLAADFGDLIRSAVSDLPASREGPHANGPVPLAVFVEPPGGAPSGSWDISVRLLLPRGVNQDQIEVVHLARREWKARPAFRLPLTVLSLGERCDSALDNLRSAQWYERDPYVRQYGMWLENAAVPSLSSALRKVSWDIVIVDEESVDAALGASARLPRPATACPRLLIFLGREQSELYVRTLRLPPGLSLLWVPLTDAEYARPVDAAEFVKRFVYGIVHDYPLHESLRATMRESRERPYLQCLARYPLLLADPKSNQDIRMSDAVMQLLDDATTLDKSISVLSEDEIELFARRVGREVYSAEADAPLSTYLRVASTHEEHGRNIRQAISEAQNLSYNFQQETWGLAPLARAEASVAKARQSERHISEALSALTRYSEYVEALREHQNRVVDIGLQQLESIPIYQPVDPFYPLRPDTRYRVRVHIGNQMEDSLVTGIVSPIDPLLPETEKQQGHVLEVGLFDNDFTLLSQSVQPVYLPLLGGSQPVYFEIRTPSRASTARARVGVYHQNHLLQAFLFEARIEQGQVRGAGERKVRARLAFSRTARFTNLDELKPRAVSIGLNESAGGATHDFMVKASKKGQSVKLPEAVIGDKIAEYRKILLDATRDKAGDARFSTYIPPGTPPSEDFKQVARQLAGVGNELYRRLFHQSSRDIRMELRRLARRMDETIQIIRYSPNYAFPWVSMYDFQIPDGDASLHPVCMGVGPASGAGGVAQGEGAGVPCGHGPTDKVYCVWGFWGVRHCVEELLAIGDSLKNAVAVVERAPEGPAVTLAVGEEDEHTAGMAKELKDRLGTRLSLLSGKEDLLELLWKPTERPAVLIILGHMDKEPARILLAKSPTEKWLMPKNIDDRLIASEEWEQPRTIVLLLGCDSAATELVTVSDFVISLISAGALGIVGTECLAYTRLVSRFAKEVTADLLLARPPKSLGAAVKEFNRRMILSGNPLGFVFSYLGDADLTVTA